MSRPADFGKGNPIVHVQSRARNGNLWYDDQNSVTLRFAITIAISLLKENRYGKLQPKISFILTGNKTGFSRKCMV